MAHEARDTSVVTTADALRLGPASGVPTGIYAGIFLSVLAELVVLGAAIASWGDGGGSALGGVVTVTGAPLLAVVLALAWATITWGFWTRRPWSRHAAMVGWLALGIMRPWPAGIDGVAAAIIQLEILAAVWWYLYRGASVHRWLHPRSPDASKVAPPTVRQVVIGLLIWFATQMLLDAVPEVTAGLPGGRSVVLLAMASVPGVAMFVWAWMAARRSPVDPRVA